MVENLSHCPHLDRSCAGCLEWTTHNGLILIVFFPHHELFSQKVEEVEHTWYINKNQTAKAAELSAEQPDFRAFIMKVADVGQPSFWVSQPATNNGSLSKWLQSASQWCKACISWPWVGHLKRAAMASF